MCSDTGFSSLPSPTASVLSVLHRCSAISCDCRSRCRSNSRRFARLSAKFAGSSTMMLPLAVPARRLSAIRRQKSVASYPVPSFRSLCHVSCHSLKGTSRSQWISLFTHIVLCALSVIWLMLYILYITRTRRSTVCTAGRSSAAHVSRAPCPPARRAARRQCAPFATRCSCAIRHLIFQSFLLRRPPLRLRRPPHRHRRPISRWALAAQLSQQYTTRMCSIHLLICSLIHSI